MKSSILVSTLAIFSSLAAAIPAPPTITYRAAILPRLAAAIPAPPTVTYRAAILPRDHRAKQVLHSSKLVNILEDSPNTPQGVTGTAKVSRVAGKHNSQTLATFDMSDRLAGLKCRLVFTDPTAVGGSQTIQIFSLASADIGGATFENRPSRNQFAGTLYVEPYGQARVFDGSGLTFDCPTSGSIGFEVVSVGDDNNVEWNVPSGLAIYAE